MKVMKKSGIYVLALLTLVVMSCRQDFAASFADPDDEYGIDVWWLWHNSYVSKDAMTAELKAMKDMHFHGFTVYDTGGHDQRGNKSLPCGPMFGTPEWNDLLRHALKTADSLGLKASLVLQSGWNLGGPMVTRDDMAKHVVGSETIIKGGKKAALYLEKPEGLFDWYKDIAVLAFPLSDRSEDKISSLRYKTCDRELGMSTPDSRYLLFNDPDPSKDKAWVASVESILDVTAFMNESGYFEWDAPQGDWAILRMGYAPTGSKVSTSSDNWGGYSLDHLSKSPLKTYWDGTVMPVLACVKDYLSTTLQTVETDSWEAGGMNWTDDFRTYFNEYCGYDIVKYLPTVLGYVVGGERETSSFLADWRKTIADMIARNHYEYLAELAHAEGLLTMPESAGPHAGPFDGIKNYGYNDVLMSEFWSPSPHRPLPKNKFFVKQASSAAHIYGKKIVNAEAFTTIGRTWDVTFWKDQKSAFDHEICSGMNRICIHSFASSPTEMGVPGAQSFAGSYFDNRNTWWDYAAPVFDYFRRVQYVAQNGRFKPDVLYYYGDQVPNVYPLKEADMAGAMPGFDYDVTDETILLQLEVRGGKVVTPSGMSYQVLVLPDHQTLSLEALVKVKELVYDGAVVIAAKPMNLITLKGGSAAQEQFKAISDEIWGQEEQKYGNRCYGEGKVVWGISSRDYLLASGIPMDFSIEQDPELSGFDFIHYEIEGKDFYFICNQTDVEQSVKARFRSVGRQPEFWNPLDGSIAPIQEFLIDGSITEMPLHFDPYGSIIVVFDRESGAKIRCVRKPEYIKSLEVSGPWVLNFSEEFDGLSEPVYYEELNDLCQSDILKIRYYSGPVTYNTSFDFSLEENKEYELTLGEVGHVGLACVRLNGKDLGFRWTKPFRFDVSQSLKDGLNELEVTVVNSWYNRVAGEELYPEMKRLTRTNIVLSHDYMGKPISEIPLPVSGLIGPVEIYNR